MKSGKTEQLFGEPVPEGRPNGVTHYVHDNDPIYIYIYP